MIRRASLNSAVFFYSTRRISVKPTAWRRTRIKRWRSLTLRNRSFGTWRNGEQMPEGIADIQQLEGEKMTQYLLTVTISLHRKTACVTICEVGGRGPQKAGRWTEQNIVTKKYLQEYTWKTKWSLQSKSQKNPMTETKRDPTETDREHNTSKMMRQWETPWTRRKGLIGSIQGTRMTRTADDKKTNKTKNTTACCRNEMPGGRQRTGRCHLVAH